MAEKDSRELIESLEEAGAGISPLKRLAAKHIMFPLLDTFISWERAWDIYDKEGRRIIALASPLEDEKLFKRILVPQLFGLEDNSRYYSVAMVLRHLLTVGEALQKRIPPLSRGEKLQNEVSIEDVKPYTDIDADIVERFTEHLSTYRKELDENTEDIHIDNTAEHPWFGPFNPKQWSILAMVHQTVHRRQIEAILQRL